MLKYTNTLKTLKFITLAFLWLYGSIHAASQTLGFSGEEATSVGIYIKDIRSDKVLVDINSRLALTPASILKSLTSATALSVLGQDFRFETEVRLRGSQGASGVWNGDLVIISSGDPTLESANFKSNCGFLDDIAAALKKKGIGKITGNIIVQQTMKDAGPVLQWEVEDLGWSYGAGLFGLNYKDNIFTVHPATKKTTPEIPGLKITVNKGLSNEVIRGIYSDNLVIYSRNPADRKWTVNSTMPDPAAVFTSDLKKVLAENGISVSGQKKATNSASTKLLTHKSPCASEILKSLMIRSDNMFAEGMLRAITPAGTRAEAIKIEKELWNARNVTTQYTIIHDGSGLTRANRVSPRFMGDMLEWMANSDMAQTYTSFFPKVGKEGTVKSFLADSELSGRLALKTGSVSSVQCYAGYALNSENIPTHVIVIMINGFFCPRTQIRKAAEQLLERTFCN